MTLSRLPWDPGSLCSTPPRGLSPRLCLGILSSLQASAEPRLPLWSGGNSRVWAPEAPGGQGDRGPPSSGLCQGCQDPRLNLGSRIQHAKSQGSGKRAPKGRGPKRLSHIVPSCSVTRCKNHSPFYTRGKTHVRSDLVNVTQHVKVKQWAQHPPAADPIQGQGESRLGSLRAGPRSTGAGRGRAHGSGC